MNVSIESLLRAVENLRIAEARGDREPVMELAAIFEAMKEHAKLYRLRPRHLHSAAKAERRLRKLKL